MGEKFVEQLIRLVISETDGWVFVVIFALYVALSIYRRHADNEALRLVRDTVSKLLADINTNIRALNARIEQLAAAISVFTR